MKIHAFAIVTALALPGLALADKTNEKTTNTTPAAPTAPAAPATAKLSDSDVKIVAHLHHVNKMEIDLGKAAQKSSTPGVKSYGDTLIKDHQAGDKELTAFAKSRKLAVIPADKPATDAEKQEHKAMMDKMAKLKTLKGAEFDREFLTMMATDHDKELARIDVAIGATTDTDLQNLLKATKPVLQRHADDARNLQTSTQTSSTTPTPAPTK